MKKLFCLLLITSSFFYSSCKKEDPKDQIPDPCINNEFHLYNLSKGYLPTDVAEDKVNMLFQVLDADGKGVINLDDKNKYSLIDNQDEMISNVEASVVIEPFGTIPTSVKTAIVLDISKSVQGLVPQIKQAAIEFINLSLDEQEIAIYTFDGDPPVRRINYTSNKTQLISAINSLPETDLGTSTNLYEALIQVNNEAPSDLYTLNEIRQSNIIVFTDGKETANPTQAAYQNVLNKLSGRTVFIAALNSPDLDAEKLKNIASSANNYFLANDIGELKTKFKEIQTDIEKLSKSVYWLYYTSPRKGTTTWDIKLRIKDNCNTGISSSANGTYSSQGF